MTPGADDERDAWLREALRHAPDAQLGAPPSLGERILREAKAKARTGAAAPPRGAIARGWAWLARPPVSAGFASVMVATMVGLLWWDQSPPPTPPTPPTPTSQTAQTAPPMAPAPEMPAETAQTPAAPPPAAPARSETRSPAADAPEVAPKRRARETTPSAGATSAATADAAAKAMAPAPAAERQVAEPATAQTDPSLRSFARGAPAVASLAPRDTRLAALRESLADEAPRWSWQRPPSSAQPMTEPLRAWFAQLEAATAGRWEPDTLGTAAAAPELRLLHDGRMQHRFGFDGNTIRWETTPAEAAAPLRQRATLSTSEADTLRTALEHSAR
ncbi:hypothetical protein [Piscinibacter sp.]|uniref:hypothetical protein n=1 Tax=Piscinibacter sp. TaxID=1903157 RepID=UPI002D0DC664|nr:hypothetical protein [Albitalea sp.]HUG22829.1 hypothetical protein [Albitalea sp.]